MLLLASSGQPSVKSRGANIKKDLVNASTKQPPSLSMLWGMPGKGATTLRAFCGGLLFLELPSCQSQAIASPLFSRKHPSHHAVTFGQTRLEKDQEWSHHMTSWALQTKHFDVMGCRPIKFAASELRRVLRIRWSNAVCFRIRAGPGRLRRGTYGARGLHKRVWQGWTVEVAGGTWSFSMQASMAEFSGQAVLDCRNLWTGSFGAAGADLELSRMENVKFQAKKRQKYVSGGRFGVPGRKTPNPTKKNQK